MTTKSMQNKQSVMSFRMKFHTSTELQRLYVYILTHDGVLYKLIDPEVSGTQQKTMNNFSNSLIFFTCIQIQWHYMDPLGRPYFGISCYFLGWAIHVKPLQCQSTNVTLNACLINLSDGARAPALYTEVSTVHFLYKKVLKRLNERKPIVR